MEIIEKFASIIVNPAIMVLFALAFVIFLWGVVQYIRNSSSSESNTTGRDHILWGLIGMAIMVSAFTIIKIVIGTFDIPEPELIRGKY
jgi:uncharacterized membrane protein YjfL (UPF0719 family)